MTLVVPCFNEAARLDVAAFAALSAARPRLGLLFVDDGSTDGTAEVLDRLRAVAPGDVRVLRLERNAGKAEAVRRGLLAAVESGAEVIGFTDADLATPPEELLRLLREADERPAAILLGARVRLLGARIERRADRHYLGRVFATVASLALRLPVYDTQCGAKLFLVSPALEAALARPFRSRWIFDVELLDRLLRGAPGVEPVRAEQMREVPLRAWRDVAGSSLRPRAMLRAGLQLLSLLIRSRLRPRLEPGAAPRGASGATVGVGIAGPTVPAAGASKVDPR